MYEALREKAELDYGPVFQPLHDVYCDQDGHAITTLAPYETETFQPHVVHPSRLDGIFQLCFTAVGGLERTTTMVPTRVGRIWIPAVGLGHTNQLLGKTKVLATAVNIRKRTAVANM